LGTGTLRRVHRHLRGRQFEDQSAAAGVNVWVFEHILEEGPVRLGIRL